MVETGGGELYHEHELRVVLFGPSAETKVFMVTT